MKIIDKIVVSPTPPTQIQNAAWFDGKEIKIPSKGKFESTGGSGGGIEIVDSVDKLDPNAELGSMASVVTAGSIQETSFRNLYQPDMSILDPNTYTLNTEDCSLVGGLSITPPSAPIESASNIMLAFSTANINLAFPVAGAIMMQLQFVPNADNTKLIGLGGMVMDVATQTTTNYTFFSINDDGSVTVNQDQIDALNDVFADNELYYLGTFMYALEGAEVPADFYDVVDTSIKAVSSIPSITNIYVKGDKWGQLYKKDLDKLASDLDKTKTTAESKADKIIISPNNTATELSPNVYTIQTINSTDSLVIRLAAIADTTIYNEYILEVKCLKTPSKVTFDNPDGTIAIIKWANDTPPSFEAGFTYLISIANNFAVFAQYVNS
jgi:hypothetical protein